MRDNQSLALLNTRFDKLPANVPLTPNSLHIGFFGPRSSWRHRSGGFRAQQRLRSHQWLHRGRAAPEQTADVAGLVFSRASVAPKRNLVERPVLRTACRISDEPPLFIGNPKHCWRGMGPLRVGSGLGRTLYRLNARANAHIYLLLTNAQGALGCGVSSLPWGWNLPRADVRARRGAMRAGKTPEDFPCGWDRILAPLRMPVRTRERMNARTARKCQLLTADSVKNANQNHERRSESAPFRMDPPQHLVLVRAVTRSYVRTFV